MKLVMKFVLIGNSGCGKTTLAWRYKFEEYREFFNMTVGVDVQTKTYPMFSTDLKILLWDTAGQERFQSISAAFYRDSIAVFLCFDHTDRKSFQDIEKWLSLMLDYLPDYVQIVLVGLKKDLVDKIQVSELEARTFARSHHMTFYSVSSKTGENVDKIFLDTATQIYCDYKAGKIEIKERMGGLRVQEEKDKSKRYRYSCLWPW